MKNNVETVYNFSFRFQFGSGILLYIYAKNINSCMIIDNKHT